MALARPVFCRPRAYDLFTAQLPVLETPGGLLAAAVAISMHELGEADPVVVDGRVQALADRVRGRVRSRQPQAVLAHAHAVLFEEEGFAGNADDYYNPVNSYLPAVLQTKRGLPITLALLYKSVLERLGLRVHGIGAPWRFLAGVDTAESADPPGFPGIAAIPGTPGAEGAPATSLMLVDVFAGGRTVTAEEVAGRVREAVGMPIEDPAQVVPITTHRQWVARMLANLQHVFGRGGQRENLAAMVELRTALEGTG